MFRVLSFNPIYLYAYQKKRVYALCIGFQERCNSHVHSFIWIFNVPNFRDETIYVGFPENMLNVQFPEAESKPDLF